MNNSDANKLILIVEDEPKIAEAKKMMAEGKENLNFVQFGNGVHNKKYALFVLDAAITRFEDVLDFIEENQQ